MTLDEAIQHCKEKAKELSDKAYQEWGVSVTEEEAYDCNECAREHEQLAKWLEDYKRLLGERPHGKWLEWVDEKWGGTTIYCSVCKLKALRSSTNDFVMSNFCPNCGADMREEDLSDDGCGGY